MSRHPDHPISAHEDLYFWTDEEREDEPEEVFEPTDVLDAFHWLQERVNRAVRKNT